MSELRTNRIVPRDGLPSGSSGGIIQVKSVTKTDTFTKPTNTTAFVDITGLSVSITPTRSDSKILVSFNCHYDNNIANQRAYITIYRSIGGGTASDIVGSRGLVEVWNPDQRIQASCMAQYLDSPSTPSAITYTVYARVDTAGGDFYLGLYNNKKWMHAMEVSG